ncbi:polyprenyl synthetase family protein [Brachybacterium saurashtrense]|uniref:Polyprenyl synthetase family protein n=1 Tax=Brachybacterium saurashtrense TaxID=556288 RepID=A0A345YNU9_9MICO|nr:polyprenyl synthetase family protein [Brachybacterium saurashtrense]AXK45601.1 polyprenyl synthetase family protein [Brachybacterium saurashtrense]RRR21028.1 polyprenyl synthetase family protein [Brachybacterium saurashtrense]
MPSTLPGVPDIDESLATSIVERLAEIESRLRDSVATSDDMVRWTGRHLMDAGGKRVRPMLVLLAASLGDVEADGVVEAAVLVELTHLASLYHDDVMDSAPTRRGTDSAHALWGNNVAILTGDFLFARASALSARIGVDAVRQHSETFERLCLGQLHETVGPTVEDDPFEHYISVLSDKTASLLALAGDLGASLSGAPEGTASVMRRYGEKIGVAFQLADDVLDLESDAHTSGKTPGIDLREGVPTMPTLLVRRRAQEQQDARSLEIVRRLDGDLGEDASLAELVALLRADPALEETRELALRTSDEAVEILSELPEGPVREALIAFTTTLVQRSR